MKTPKLHLLSLILFLFYQNINAQEVLYIKKDTFTKIVAVNENSNHGDDFLRVNVFYGEFDKVKWGSAITITSYTYLGVDSQNNLHVRKTENDFTLKKEDSCKLIFKLDQNKPTEITLVAQKGQRVPLLIKVQVEAGNNFIKTKYLGDLPKYIE
jgi:hypothetical protein